MPPLLSVVLPVYDERETLEALFARLLPVLDRIADGAFEADVMGETLARSALAGLQQGAGVNLELLYLATGTRVVVAADDLDKAETAV